MLRRKKSITDKVFKDIKNDKQKSPKNRLFKGFLYSLAGAAASAGIIAGGYFINQYPGENRYNVEKRV